MSLVHAGQLKKVIQALGWEGRARHSEKEQVRLEARGSLARAGAPARLSLDSVPVPAK